MFNFRGILFLAVLLCAPFSQAESAGASGTQSANKNRSQSHGDSDPGAESEKNQKQEEQKEADEIDQLLTDISSLAENADPETIEKLKERIRALADSNPQELNRFVQQLNAQLDDPRNAAKAPLLRDLREIALQKMPAQPSLAGESAAPPSNPNLAQPGGQHPWDVSVFPKPTNLPQPGATPLSNGLSAKVPERISQQPVSQKPGFPSFSQLPQPQGNYSVPATVTRPNLSGSGTSDSGNGPASNPQGNVFGASVPSLPPLASTTVIQPSIKSVRNESAGGGATTPPVFSDKVFSLANSAVDRTPSAIGPTGSEIREMNPPASVGKSADMAAVAGSGNAVSNPVASASTVISASQKPFGDEFFNSIGQPSSSGSYSGSGATPSGRAFSSLDPEVPFSRGASLPDEATKGGAEPEREQPRPVEIPTSPAKGFDLPDIEDVVSRDFLPEARSQEAETDFAPVKAAVVSLPKKGPYKPPLEVTEEEMVPSLVPIKVGTKTNSSQPTARPLPAEKTPLPLPGTRSSLREFAEIGF